MMMAGGDPGRGATYYRLRGETIGGESIDLPAASLTDALSWRNWSLTSETVKNKQFTINNPHPSNAALAASVRRGWAAARSPDAARPRHRPPPP